MKILGKEEHERVRYLKESIYMLGSVKLLNRPSIK